MTLDFYYMPASGPCRAVLMVAKELNIPLNLKELDLLSGQHLSPEFTAINPQHCVPTLHDTKSGLILWESRALMTYMVNKFAPGHSLYPSDPVKRAQVDRLLYFDIGTLYSALREAIYPELFGMGTWSEAAQQTFKDKLALLDSFLTGNKYVAGAGLTLADLSILASLTFADVVSYDYSPFANITAWRQRLSKELSYNKEVNDEPLRLLKLWHDSKAK